MLAWSLVLPSVQNHWTKKGLKLKAQRNNQNMKKVLLNSLQSSLKSHTLWVTLNTAVKYTKYLRYTICFNFSWLYKQNI